MPSKTTEEEPGGRIGGFAGSQDLSDLRGENVAHWYSSLVLLTNRGEWKGLSGWWSTFQGAASEEGKGDFGPSKGSNTIGGSEQLEARHAG